MYARKSTSTPVARFPLTIPGLRTGLAYNGPQDNRKLRYMMKRQCRWFWTHVYNIFVDSPDGRRIIDFELEYIDL